MDQPRAGTMVRRDVPTCRPHDPLHDIGARMKATRWDLCAVLDDEQVLLGLVDAGALRGAASITAEQVMQFAPTTIRPHLPLDDLAARLKKRDHMLVTTSDGRFLGVLLRSDVERKMIERERIPAGLSEPAGQGPHGSDRGRGRLNGERGGLGRASTS